MTKAEHTLAPKDVAQKIEQGRAATWRDRLGNRRFSLSDAEVTVLLAACNSHEALVKALEELRDLMRDVIDGNYKPDSFTLQLADAALRLAKGE